MQLNVDDLREMEMGWRETNYQEKKEYLTIRMETYYGIIREIEEDYSLRKGEDDIYADVRNRFLNDNVINKNRVYDYILGEYESEEKEEEY